MTREERDELYEQCYECGGYGDDYSYDEESDSLVSNCDDCWVAERLLLEETEE